MTTRQRALDAAIELLGTDGLRALTHSRVDDAAGLPRGSASNHFRTRSALLAGTADRIAERELVAVDAATADATAGAFVDRLCALLDTTTVANRTLSTARLVLFVESSHDAALREALDHGRSAMESSTASALAMLGAADPALAARTLMACLEGLILHRIARHDDADVRPVVELAVRAALQP